MPTKSKKPASNVFAGAIAGINESVSAFFEGAQQFPVALDQIDVAPRQIREELEDEENTLQELADSIKSLGVISPILLRKKNNGHFQLIAGERRFRAAVIAGLAEIPALVREMTDQQAEDMQAAENIQRKNLTHIELARRLQKDMDELGSVEAVMARRNKSRSWISKILSLNNLTPQAQRLVSEGVTSDLAIIGGVRQIEERDPSAAKTLVDDLKQSMGQGDSRAKVDRARQQVKPTANKAKAAAYSLADLYAEVITGDAKAIAAALTPAQKEACMELHSCFDQGRATGKIGPVIFHGFNSRKFNTSGAGALRLAAFLRGMDAGPSGRFSLAEVLRLVQSA